MMRSLFSGVSGLKSHQTRMDVIGNNIANVNTTAYKSKMMNFSDMLYQTTQAASGPGTNVGGINPRQIGLGVKTAAINTTITQEGATQSTGNPFDLKLTGEAFFVVSDGTNTYYTRDGSFNVDEDGNLCMASTGYIVQGWGVDANGDIIQGSVSNLNVMSKSNYEPAYTTAATISGIIDATDSNLETKNGKIFNLQILDNLGYEYNLQFGILPQKVVESGTRDIHNTENAYTLPNGTPDTLYKVDTSKLEYSYNVGGENRIISSTDSPDLITALDKAVWAYIQNNSAAPTVNEKTLAIKGKHELGDKTDLNKEDADPVTITINDDFLAAYGLSMLQFGALNGQDITVSFSGDVGYVKSNTVPTYPLSTDLSISKIDDEAVALFYTVGEAVNGIAACTLADAAYGDVTTIKQDYEDNDGNAITDYIFKDNKGDEITDAMSKRDLYGDIMRLMKLGTENKVQDSYYTKQAKDTESIDPGKYTITLLGMSSYGEEVNIDTLLNNGTTSWDLVYNPDNGQFDYVGESGNDAFTVALSSLDNKFSNISIDLTDTQNVFNEGKSTVTGLRDDGRTVGKMTGVSIAQDGLITANYSNGMSAVLGQICVGTFANSMGLQNEGDNLYSQTANSGECVTVDIKASGTGYMTTGVLEMSNVDLSQEFTNMITTQRGFQANSRIITTSDSLLEELVNLKR
ncbi:MAG: flagellar hook-basal body complex protein [Lachnospiraceae bacterium]|nr:flagellar hook-basal body complex protein [Lachnospiraceae bacterium]